MKTNKLLMICVALVLLFAAVSLSGCLGGDDANNTTPENNSTAPENNSTAPENNTTVPENNTTVPETPAPPQSSGSVTIVMGEAGDAEPNYFIRTSNQKFSTSSLTISKGETVRFMNTESRTFRHLYHSADGAFEDFSLDPRYSATATFNAAGTYKIELLNHYSGEPFGTSPQVLTVTVN